MSAGRDIAFLTQGWSPEPGGVETHTLALARALIERGHRVRVLCLDGGSGREPYSVRAERSDGLDIARMAYRYHDHRALADLIRNPRAEEVVLDWLAADRCDVLHVHHLTGFGAGVLERLRGTPLGLVVSLHDYWMLCPRGQMFDSDGRAVGQPEPDRCGRCLAATWPHLMPSGSGERRGPAGTAVARDAEAAAARTSFALGALGAADFLVLPSPAAQAAFERAGLRAEQLRVVEYGIEAASLARAAARERAAHARRNGPRRNGNELVLGFVGSVLPSKGPLELARAVLAAEVPGLRLEIHGPQPSWHGDTSYLHALRELAGREARIALHGAFAPRELPRVLARLDALAVPSLWAETYGLVAREARAAGLPVLVSGQGGLPPAAGGGGGEVVAADDPGAWVAALRRLPGLRERVRAQDALSTAAPAGIRSLGAMVAEIEVLYGEASRGRGDRSDRGGAILPTSGAEEALDDRDECVESRAS